MYTYSCITAIQHNECPLAQFAKAVEYTDCIYAEK